MEFFKAFFLLYEYNENEQLDSNNFERNNRFINLNGIFFKQFIMDISIKNRKNN